MHLQCLVYVRDVLSCVVFGAHFGTSFSETPGDHSCHDVDDCYGFVLDQNTEACEKWEKRHTRKVLNFEQAEKRNEVLPGNFVAIVALMVAFQH